MNAFRLQSPNRAAIARAAQDASYVPAHAADMRALRREQLAGEEWADEIANDAHCQFDVDSCVDIIDAGF